MSLNGDMLVMRNGRSTSEISIYNYPEHLNPFYEDEQHKRLRFWHINKGNQSGRRNSFSISNLKDMWAFKSFRMKKKSSTLGINKTSESPPPLRRDFQYSNNADHFNSVGRSARYADGADQFERGVGYRSSLQNMHSSQDRGFGLTRNDNYRRTLQQGELSAQPRRYVYGGSATPQPQRSNANDGTYNDSLRMGSSRLSVNTNPFDSDNEDEEMLNRSATSRGSSLSISSRTPRKKRKAPAPPVQVHKVSDELNGTLNSSHPNTELRIEEANDISSLTAEIESFVKTTSHESPEKEIATSRLSCSNAPAQHSTPKSNGSIANGAIPKQIIITEETKIVVSTNSSKHAPQQAEQKQINLTSKQEQVNLSPKEAEVLLITEEKKMSHTEPAEFKQSNIERQQNLEVKLTNKLATVQENKPKQLNNVATVQETKQLVLEKEANKQTESKQRGDSVEHKQSNIMAPEAEKLIVKHAEIKKSSCQSIDKSKALKQHNELANASSMLIIEESKATNGIREAPPRARKSSQAEQQLHISAPIEASSSNKEAEMSNVECIHVHVESPRATPRNAENSRMTSFSHNNEIITAQTSFTLTSPPAARKQFQANAEETAAAVKPPIAVKPDVKPKSGSPPLADIHRPRTNSIAHEAITPIKPPRLPADELQQNHEQPAAMPAQQQIQSTTMVNNSSTTTASNAASTPSSPAVRASSSRALHDEFDALYRMRTASSMEWKSSTLAPLEPHVPKEKRRSVKDIIESINRNQRLLKPGVPPGSESIPNCTIEEPPPSYYSSTVTSSSSSNFNQRKPSLSLEEAQNEIKRMYGEIAIAENAATSSTAAATASSSAETSAPPQQQPATGNGVFMKSRITKEVYDYRESSPTSSNLDWNPLPKPKRSKNLNDV